MLRSEHLGLYVALVDRVHVEENFYIWFLGRSHRWAQAWEFDAPRLSDKRQTYISRSLPSTTVDAPHSVLMSHRDVQRLQLRYEMNMQTTAALKARLATV